MWQRSPLWLATMAALWVPTMGHCQGQPPAADDRAIKQIAVAVGRLEGQLLNDKDCLAKRGLFSSAPPKAKIYIAGIQQSDAKLAADQREWLLDAIHTKLNEGAVIASLPDTTELVELLLRDGQGLKDIRAAWEKQAKPPTDVLVVVRVVRETDRGHQLSLLAYGVAGGGSAGCEKGVSIDSIDIPRSTHRLPLAVMETAARELLKNHSSPGVVLVNRVALRNGSLNADCANLIAIQLRGAIQKVFRERVTFGDTRHLATPPADAVKRRPEDGPAPWLASIDLTESSDGYSMEATFERSASEAFGDNGMITPESLKCKSIVGNLPVIVGTSQPSYKVSEEIRYTLTVTKSSYLYCYLDEPATGEMQVVLPAPSAESRFFISSSKQPIILKGDDFELAGPLTADRASDFAFICFALEKRLPDPQHRQWMKQHVVEGLKRLERDGVAADKPEARKYLAVPQELKATLIEALRASQGRETRVRVHVE